MLVPVSRNLVTFLISLQSKWGLLYRLQTILYVLAIFRKIVWLFLSVSRVAVVDEGREAEISKLSVVDIHATCPLSQVFLYRCQFLRLKSKLNWSTQGLELYMRFCVQLFVDAWSSLLRLKTERNT